MAAFYCVDGEVMMLAAYPWLYSILKLLLFRWPCPDFPVCHLSFELVSRDVYIM